MEKKIYDKDRLYEILKPYVNWNFKNSYEQFNVIGRENIPEDGAVIVTPNHTNALMDALAVLYAMNRPVVFGARADIFRKKSIADILGFLKIIPLTRRRDGLRNVARNKESIENIVEIVSHDVPFCLFPEGTHRAKRSLLPIGKMPLRLALSAIESLPADKPVYILPISIEYSDYFRYRSSCLITISKPIDVRQELATFGEENHNESEMYAHFSEMIKKALAEHLTYLPDGESFDQRWALVKLLASGRNDTGEERLTTNRKCIVRILEKEKSAPSRMEDIYRKTVECDRLRRENRISVRSFDDGLGKRILTKTISGLWVIPNLLVSLVLCWPLLAISFVTKKMVGDKAFLNTATMAVNMALMPLQVIINAVICFCVSPWYLALILTLLTVGSYHRFYDCVEFYRVYFSDWRLLAKPALRKQAAGIRRETDAL